MASIKTHAIILKTQHFSETDKLVTLLSRDHGKLKVIAKGALRLTSKFGARLLPLAYDEVLLSEGRHLHILTECQSIRLFPELRADTTKMELGLRMASFLEETLPLGYSQPELFPLFRDLLAGLSESPNIETAQMTALAFLFKFLEKEGHLPELKKCIVCRREMKAPPQKIAFEIDAGGIICRQCCRSYSNIHILPYSCIQLLESWKDQSLLNIAHAKERVPSAWLIPLLQEYTDRVLP